MVAACISGSSERFDAVLIDQYIQANLVNPLPSSKDEAILSANGQKWSGDWKEFAMGRYCDGYMTRASHVIFVIFE